MAHGNHVNSVWSNLENIETLKRLVIEGLSASQIAKAIGCGVTRNAVIGKIHRMGLGSTRVIPANRPKQTRQPRVRRVPSPHGNSVSAAKPRVRGDVNGFAGVNAIRRRAAEDYDLPRWPVGDPSKEDFFFCGAVADGDKPYCHDHCVRAYEPSKSRRQMPHFKYVARRKTFSATAIIAGAIDEAEAA